MKPKYFKQANVELGKPPGMTDEECHSLWIQTDQKVCISLWCASFWERVKFLFHGKIWLGVYSGMTQPPVWLDCKNRLFRRSNG